MKLSSRDIDLLWEALCLACQWNDSLVDANRTAADPESIRKWNAETKQFEQMLKRLKPLRKGKE